VPELDEAGGQSFYKENKSGFYIPVERILKKSESLYFGAISVESYLKGSSLYCG
jgi:hypothetical protein